MKLFAHGKLLLTAEYLVVKGAKALAIPTKLGQHLEVKESQGSELNWKSLDHEGNEWFTAQFDLMGFDCMKTSDEAIAERLRKILRAVCNDNSDFLSKWKKYRVTTKLDFPREWGLGTSSTLLYLLSTWAEANPYLVYFNVFDGSAYDIACADADGPLFYEYTGDSIHFETADWSPAFLENLYLIHLGEKQDSNISLRDFLKRKIKKSDIKEATDLTDEFVKAHDLLTFQDVVRCHEGKMSEWIGHKTVHGERFSDFWGTVKSLGAWGGDMALVSSDRDPAATKKYFSEKGIDHFMPFSELVIL